MVIFESTGALCGGLFYLVVLGFTYERAYTWSTRTVHRSHAGLGEVCSSTDECNVDSSCSACLADRADGCIRCLALAFSAALLFPLVLLCWALRLVFRSKGKPRRHMMWLRTRALESDGVDQATAACVEAPDGEQDRLLERVSKDGCPATAQQERALHP